MAYFFVRLTCEYNAKEFVFIGHGETLEIAETAAIRSTETKLTSIHYINWKMSVGECGESTPVRIGLIKAPVVKPELDVEF